MQGKNVSELQMNYYGMFRGETKGGRCSDDLKRNKCGKTERERD